MPPWKHRRRLIYGTCVLAAGMIIFAAVTYKSDTQVSTQLIIGGVALLSITLTAYTAFATYEDMKLWKVKDEAAELLYSNESQEEIYSEEDEST